MQPVLSCKFVALQSPTAAAPPPPPAEKTEVHYGIEFPVGEHPLTIELYCYRYGITEEEGGLGKSGHFREVVNILWGPENEHKHFIWNPWADKMLESALVHKFLSVAGAASSGKSLFYAVYALVNWLCDPANTTVLITSTSMKESRGRIWADVEEWWNAAQKQMGDALPGKLVSSVGMIKFLDPTGEIKKSDRSGIHLIAGEKRKEKETIGKLIGYKNLRLLFVGDEMPELSAALLEAASGNLDSAEKEWFQFIGIGNPNSIYDPHGLFSKPKGGWKTITPEVYEWETANGYCIRFDALQSPNILAGQCIYKWLPTQAKYDAKKAELGEESLTFWRMWRGFWCPTGGSESVVSEADIIGFDCENDLVRWKDGKFIWFAFLDPGYTNGGDRSVLYFAKFGVSEETGLMTLLFVEYILLFENTMNKEVSRNFQIADQFKKECEKRGVDPSCAGVDDTGAAAFGDIVHERWSKQVVRVNFGGAASKNRVSAHDKTLACDKYKNRVTEIWCSIREYMRGNQIRGICPDLGVELTARRMVKQKSGVILKSLVESKEIMRGRTGKSPDIADAALGLLDVLRSHFHFRAAERTKIMAAGNKGWKDFMRKRGTQPAAQTLNRSFTHCGASLER